MKPWLHRVNGFHPAVLGKQCIERSMHGGAGPSEWGAEADPLSQGVNAGISATGCMGYGAAAEKPL
jgi:hypothetical protein